MRHDYGSKESGIKSIKTFEEALINIYLYWASQRSECTCCETIHDIDVFKAQMIVTLNKVIDNTHNQYVDHLEGMKK